MIYNVCSVFSASQKMCRLSYLLAMMILLLLPASFANGQQYQPTAAGAVKIAVDDLPLLFSPYADSPLALQYAHLFFDPLVRWDKNKQLEKRLVTGWKVISKGRIRFYLKKNIKFHSGNFLHSNDITWTFSQIIQPGNTIGCFEGITTIKQVGRYSFDVYSRLSQAQLLDYFSHFFVLDSQFYKKNAVSMNKVQGVIDAQEQARALSGTGPYQIKKYNPRLQLSVVANNDYWQGPAAIQALDFIKIRAANSRTFALLVDDIDISESISNKMLNTVNHTSSKSVIELPSANIVFLTINDKRSAIFKQREVRKAINLAINKAGMLKHLINGMGSVSAIYTPLNEGDAKLPVYDIAQAKSLLSREKIPLELTLLILSDAMVNTAEITTALVNMMKRLGIKLLITETQDINEWNKHLFGYDFTLSLWHSPLMNSDNIYHDLFAESALSSYFDTLFKAKSIDSSIKKQSDFFKKMQEDYQINPLFFRNKVWATDNRFNVVDIFSGNGIPYWYLLRESHNEKIE